MVSIRKAKQTGFQLRRTKGRRGGLYDKEKVGLVAAGLCIGFFVMFLYSAAFSDVSGEIGVIAESVRKTKSHPVLMETPEDGEADTDAVDPNHPPIQHPPKIVPMGDSMNAIALEVVSTLDCPKLLKEAEKTMKEVVPSDFGMDDNLDRERRRLQQHGDDGGFADFGGGAEEKKGEDDSLPEEKWGEQAVEGGDAEEEFENYINLSAKHLFCLAATESPPDVITNEINCDAKKKRRTLLDLWSAARSQMPEDLLLKVLDLAHEGREEILGNSYHIWAPSGDDGLYFMVNALNSDQDVDNGGINGLEEALGPGKLFVDVGSCLGLTCLAINKKYPGTKIVSLEPASPSWLLQELNLRCNLSKKEFKNIKVILAGVGANTDEEDDLMAKLMWRPTSTTSTRSWTPAEESKTSDLELIVRLRKLRSLLAEADVLLPNHIDVLNLDCQGCEYNLIPALSKEEFENIPTVMGNVHWGYINPNKLPSSDRGRITHQRLCGHENIARDTKECCAFPDLPVKSGIPGEVLQVGDSNNFPPKESTVSDVIMESMCDDFSSWSKERYLNDIPDDFNWFELSSQA